MRTLVFAAIAPLAGCGAGSARPEPGKPPPSVADGAFAGRIGAARRDITPPVGIYARNWGAAAHEVAEGIHRPLTATVLSFQAREGEPPLVLAAVDLGWWRTLEDEQFVRSGVLEALSLDPARLIVNLSHTHAGPSICREDRDKPGGHLIEGYLAQVRDALAAAAREAVTSARPAVLTWNPAHCDLARNRDLKDPARDRVVCGFNPSAPSETTVLVGRVTGEGGRVVATIVNYACHPTTLAWQNKLISPDFVGALREVVEGNTAGAPCLYLHGASGELGPRECYTADTAVADRNGRHLAFAALSALEGMLPPRTALEFAGVVESGAPLATWRRAATSPSTEIGAIHRTVELPLKALPSVREIDEALKTAADRVAAERLLRKKRVRRIVGDGQAARVPVWAWRLGDAFLVGQPNESYSRLQSELRRRFPGRPIVVMNLVNGSIGYMPEANLYDLDLYQVWQSPFDRGSLERMIEACARALEELGAGQ